MGDMNEWIRIIVVAEVVFSAVLAMTSPFFPKLMQKYEKPRLKEVK